MLCLKLGLLFWCMMVSLALEESRNNSRYEFLQKFRQNDYEITFERVELANYNKPHMTYCNITTFKHNRTCPLINMTTQYNIDVGSDMEMIMQVYKFASNEYRVFPIRFQVNFCQSINQNLFGLRSFTSCGTFLGCPLRKGKVYLVCNWAPLQSNFPPLMPSGQYMIEIQAIYRSLDLYLLRGYGIIHRPVPII